MDGQQQKTGYDYHLNDEGIEILVQNPTWSYRRICDICNDRWNELSRAEKGIYEKRVATLYREHAQEPGMIKDFFSSLRSRVIANRRQMQRVREQQQQEQWQHQQYHRQHQQQQQRVSYNINTINNIYGGTNLPPAPAPPHVPPRAPPASSSRAPLSFFDCLMEVERARLEAIHPGSKRKRGEASDFYDNCMYYETWEEVEPQPRDASGRWIKRPRNRKRN